MGLTAKSTNGYTTFSLAAQSVVLEGTASDSISVDSGVPQGSVLGPTLFLLYINDMPQGLTSNVRLFADDTIAYLTISSKSDTAKLQKDLDSLAIWENKWKMAFNTEKCNVISITRKKTPIKHNYKLHGQTLEAVNSAKYLGVNITSELRWSDHIAKVCNKANGTLGFLKRNLNISATSVKELAYKSLVRPNVEYASSVWDPYHQKDKDRIERVQRRAARYVLHRHGNRWSVSDMLDKLDWKTLQQRRKESRLNLMFKIDQHLVKIDNDKRLTKPTRYTRGASEQTYQIPRSNNDYRKESFFPRTIREWNQLPPDILSSGTLDRFKHHVSKRASK